MKSGLFIYLWVSSVVFLIFVCPLDSFIAYLFLGSSWRAAESTNKKPTSATGLEWEFEHFESPHKKQDELREQVKNNNNYFYYNIKLGL